MPPRHPHRRSRSDNPCTELIHLHLPRSCICQRRTVCMRPQFARPHHCTSLQGTSCTWLRPLLTGSDPSHTPYTPPLRSAHSAGSMCLPHTVYSHPLMPPWHPHRKSQWDSSCTVLLHLHPPLNCIYQRRTVCMYPQSAQPHHRTCPVHIICKGSCRDCLDTFLRRMMYTRSHYSVQRQRCFSRPHTVCSLVLRHWSGPPRRHIDPLDRRCTATPPTPRWRSYIFLRGTVCTNLYSVSTGRRTSPARCEEEAM